MRRAEEDQRELRRLYRAHVGAVFAFFAYSVPDASAEDLTASTFERVVRHWDRYDAGKGSERTWILAIARNLLVDHFRRQRFRETVSLDEHPMLHEQMAGTPDMAERFAESEELRRLLSTVSVREREILALRYGADLAVGQIAQLLELTPANVHQILSRALKKLRVRAAALPD